MALLKLKTEKKLTPQGIKDSLFYFVNVAKDFHLETKSYPQHKAFGKLYDSLADFQDSILESLMGYLDGERIGKANIAEIPAFNEKACYDMLDSLIDFSYQLYEWAGEKKYCDIENLAQSLSGAAAKCKYLLTLK